MKLEIEAHGKRLTLVKTTPAYTKHWSRGRPRDAAFLEYVYSLGLEGSCIDIGAHYGNHSIWFAKVCGLMTYSFEPIMWRELTENMYANQPLGTPCIALPYGLSDRPGAIGRLKKAEGFKTTWALDPDSEGDFPILPLDACTSAYGMRDIVMMKIDVDGMEVEVLNGAANTIQIHRPQMFVECHGDDRREKVDDIMTYLGYRKGKVFRPRTGSPTFEWIP
jgi:FkbM family methyltransferase